MQILIFNPGHHMRQIDNASFDYVGDPSRSEEAAYLILNEKLDTLDRSSGSFLENVSWLSRTMLISIFLGSYRDSGSNTTHQEINHETRLDMSMIVQA